MCKTRTPALLKRLLVWMCFVGIFAGCGMAMKMAERRLTPDFRPEDAPTPVPPDYSEASSWAARPDMDDPAELVPQGIAHRAPTASSSADVFFVHPTTYSTARGWNQPLDDARANIITDYDTIARGASAFNGCCRIFAPRYRQATLGAFFGDSLQNKAVFELAYQDVSKAFWHFIEHDNQGRPFILASHSQGTFHLMRLLEEVDRSPVRERLIAAYAIGFRFPLDKFERSYEHLEPCSSATDTGCVVAWDTYGKEAPNTNNPYTIYWYGESLERAYGQEILCTNPLNWRRGSEPASAELNLGAIPVQYDGPKPSLRDYMNEDRPLNIHISQLPAPLPSFTSARCESGILRIPKVNDKRLTNGIIGQGNYHVFDYSLFYMNIRKNAEERVGAFLEERQ